MKHILLNNPIARHLKRSQRGQSIVLLAFAFIALIAFVGLVTDIALLFVRYAALRRAVDAAAIAAAGQIRENTTYAEVSIAAQQYIELHGMSADSVLVETCETDIFQWRAGMGPWEGQPHPEGSNPLNTMPETELCDWSDPHKLVRVSAQIKSPTTFLSLIGFKEITLEATSVSETAVLDIALVIDVSESMSKETTTIHYTNAGVTLPAGSGLPTAIRPECVTQVSDPRPWVRERWGGCCNVAGTGKVGDGSRQANGLVVPNGRIWHDTNGNNMWDGDFENGIATSSKQYNPDGTLDSSTLVCYPFKDVKDAARLFIKRLDFVRGDRVVLVTFDRQGIVLDPDGSASQFRPLIRSEKVAIETLDRRVSVQINATGLHNECPRMNEAITLMFDDGVPDPDLRPFAYESIASCGNTNIGGGILVANDALTNPLDVRREAVWVMIVLSDGAANVTDKIPGISSDTQYGYWGYCPWWTFCYTSTSSQFHWPECTESNPGFTEYDPNTPICNDNVPNSRHFCFDWKTGKPEPGNTECSSTGHYDADDYARDMADFAGLIEVTPGGAPGNFITMFSIGFGSDVADEVTGAPLLRYIADAGDNGFIDNNLQQDWRDNKQLDYPSGNYPPSFGDPDPCEKVSNPRTQCGQYYFAEDLSSLSVVFEEIASRLFTRLSR